MSSRNSSCNSGETRRPKKKGKNFWNIMASRDSTCLLKLISIFIRSGPITPTRTKGGKTKRAVAEIEKSWELCHWKLRGISPENCTTFFIKPHCHMENNYYAMIWNSSFTSNNIVTTSQSYTFTATTTVLWMPSSQPEDSIQEII